MNVQTIFSIISKLSISFNKHYGSIFCSKRHTHHLTWVFASFFNIASSVSLSFFLHFLNSLPKQWNINQGNVTQSLPGFCSLLLPQLLKPCLAIVKCTINIWWMKQDHLVFTSLWALKQVAVVQTPTVDLYNVHSAKPQERRFLPVRKWTLKTWALLIMFCWWDVTHSKWQPSGIQFLPLCKRTE